MSLRYLFQCKTFESGCPQTRSITRLETICQIWAISTICMIFSVTYFPRISWVLLTHTLSEKHYGASFQLQQLSRKQLVKWRWYHNVAAPIREGVYIRGVVDIGSTEICAAIHFVYQRPFHKRSCLSGKENSLCVIKHVVPCCWLLGVRAMLSAGSFCGSCQGHQPVYASMSRNSSTREYTYHCRPRDSLGAC